MRSVASVGRAEQQGAAQERAVERALRLSYLVVLPREVGRSFPLGYARPSYNQLYFRDAITMLSLARELGTSVEDLARYQVDDAPLRVEREHMSAAAGAVIACVRRLPGPVQDVVRLRTSGLSWRKVYAQLPGRAHWSIVDDWRTAARRVWDECREDVLALQGGE